MAVNLNLAKLTVRNFIMIIVAVVWSIAAATSFITHDSIPLGTVTPVMIIITTFLFRIHDNGGKK